jgi:hypothetical protein
MMKLVAKLVAIATFAASGIFLSSTCIAQDEWPLVAGDYYEVTGISVKDGGGWKYANWLATEWKKELEFAKSKGWLKDYMILGNVYGRADEPDLYLVRVVESVPSAAEGEKRQKEYMEWQTKTLEKMVDESGNRAEYRTVLGTSLLQVLSFREK